MKKPIIFLLIVILHSGISFFCSSLIDESQFHRVFSSVSGGGIGMLFLFMCKPLAPIANFIGINELGMSNFALIGWTVLNSIVMVALGYLIAFGYLWSNKHRSSPQS